MSMPSSLEEFAALVVEGAKMFDDIVQLQTDHPSEDLSALAEGDTPRTSLQKEMVKGIMGFVDAAALLRRAATARGYPIPFKFEDYQKKIQDAE